MMIIIWLMMVNSNYWLVVYLPTPLKNDGVKVSWDDDIPNIWKVIKVHGSRSFGAWHCAAEVPKKQLPFNQDPNLFATSNGTPNHWFPCTQRHGCIFSLQVCGRSPWKDDSFGPNTPWLTTDGNSSQLPSRTWQRKPRFPMGRSCQNIQNGYRWGVVHCQVCFAEG